jgi:small-conductance mechanosensitive channel
MEETILNTWSDWGWTLVIVVAAVAVALAIHRIVFSLIERLIRTKTRVVNSVLRLANAPAMALFIILAIFLVLPILTIPLEMKSSLERVLAFTFTGAMGWLAFKLTWVINDVVAARYDVTAADNLLAREITTRVVMMQRILAASIVVITVCLILMSIPSIRQIGITLFASAGIAGIVAGLAARPALTNLIAGIQLALTQPIRIDDVVIVEGEWGWIEEIRMTFVVVRVWDLRRLVVPLSYFIEKPFQNWTRTKADILGTVFLYVDYGVPVQRVREELHRILKMNDLWDGEVWGLQVTNATDQAIELRALMGARNSEDAWNLRCHVREQLIDFLHREHPGSLPRLRAEFSETLEKAADTVPEKATRFAGGLGQVEGANDETVADPKTRKD